MRNVNGLSINKLVFHTSKVIPIKALSSLTKERVLLLYAPYGQQIIELEVGATIPSKNSIDANVSLFVLTYSAF